MAGAIVESPGTIAGTGVNCTVQVSIPHKLRITIKPGDRIEADASLDSGCDSTPESVRRRR